MDGVPIGPRRARGNGCIGPACYTGFGAHYRRTLNVTPYGDPSVHIDIGEGRYAATHETSERNVRMPRGGWD